MISKLKWKRGDGGYEGTPRCMNPDMNSYDTPMFVIYSDGSVWFVSGHREEPEFSSAAKAKQFCQKKFERFILANIKV